MGLLSPSQFETFSEKGEGKYEGAGLVRDPAWRFELGSTFVGCQGSLHVLVHAFGCHERSTKFLSRTGHQIGTGFMESMFLCACLKTMNQEIFECRMEPVPGEGA